MYQNETGFAWKWLWGVFALLLIFSFQNCAKDEIDRSTDSASKQAIPLEQAPIIAMTQTGGDEIYSGATVRFESDMQDSGMQYTWFFKAAASGQVVTLDSKTFVNSLSDMKPYQSGDYWLEVTNGAGATAKSNEITVTVKPSPFTSQPNSQRKNLDQNVTFSAQLSSAQQH